MVAASHLKPFTPTREDPQRLDDRTVGREAIIAKTVDRLTKAATTKDRTHTLLIGPRGSGKTHVVEVALHRVTQHEDADRLLIIRVPEDLVGVARYADLLVDLVVLSDESRLDEARSRRDSGELQGLEELIGEIAGERTVVLAIENFSRLFDTLGIEGQRALRAWVESARRVVLLATAPLLDKSLADRDAPWFGSFAPDYLEELSVDEGQQLLIELHHDDPALAEYLASDTARRRLEAVAHLAGGSPRLWIIAAMCVTIEALDELVPAVEALLEKLVPYYQERLWELSALEQKLVRTIAESGLISVGDLAAATGEDQRSVATTLGRLEQVRWVRGAKRPGRDRRRTFYELREPLVRYHLDYRNTDRDTLRFIVDILRAWFDPQQRLATLGSTHLGEATINHIAASLADATLRSDHAYASRNAEELLATARVWAAGHDSDIGSPAAGALLVSLVEATAREEDRPQAVGERLAAALLTTADADRPLLQLIEACWNGAAAPADALRKITAIDCRDRPKQFQMIVREEVAYYTGETGDPQTAFTLYTQLLSDLHEPAMDQPRLRDAVTALWIYTAKILHRSDPSALDGLPAELRRLVEAETPPPDDE